MTQSIPVAAPVNVQSHATSSPAITRIASIDIIRALTMVLMIFVNDLGSLKNIPGWLEHVEPGVDGIGLADVVFPAFLFIVGLSLPFAVSNRRKKGDTDMQLVMHILSRSIALLVMGVFLVNGETINAAATGIPHYLWNPLCCLSFILVWNHYPAGLTRVVVKALRVFGMLVLAWLAIIYRGSEGTEIYRFSPHWWGILGLIGWAYLASALITVFSKGRFIPVLAGWLFFCTLSMVYKAQLLPAGSIISIIPEAILGGTLTALTMGGVLASLVFRHFQNRGQNLRMTAIFLAASAVFIAASVFTRQFWGLAKLGATPAWLFLCSAFTLLAFTAVFWIADVWRKSSWFNFIKPAGTDTLLCYLIPYFLLFTLRIFHIHFPDVMITGGVGLVKSLLLALVCVWITRLLNQAGVRLKL
jgi:heparan-alpha-glucosaminide N-acetyltransferase